MGQKPSGQPRLKIGILKWGEEGLSCGTETLTCGLWSCLWVGRSQNWAELEHVSPAYISSIYLLIYENCLAVWEKEPTHCNGVQNHKGPMIRYNLVGINNKKMSGSPHHRKTSQLFQHLIYSLILRLFVDLIVFASGQWMNSLRPPGYCWVSRNLVNGIGFRQSLLMPYLRSPISTQGMKCFHKH